MATREIDKQYWQGVLEQLSTQLAAQRVEIEADSLDLGAQIEAEWVQLRGIDYDPIEETVTIDTADGPHRIEDPERLLIADQGPEILALELIGGDGTQRILRFRSPLMLTGPAKV